MPRAKKAVTESVTDGSELVSESNVNTGTEPATEGQPFSHLDYHREQRARIGAGHLECHQCGEIIPNEVLEPSEISGSSCKPSYHQEQRERIGAGFLMCDVCQMQIPN